MNHAVIVDTGLSVNLYPVGDTHVGAAACDEAANKALSEHIANDSSAFAIGLGDYIEAVAPSDKRWSSGELPDYADKNFSDNIFYLQTMRFCKLYESASGRFAALIRGNHEQTAISRYHFDPVAIISQYMRAPYVGAGSHCGWIVFRMRDENGKVRARVKVYVAHGWGSGMKGGVATKLQCVLWKKDADIVILAHTHQPLAFPETVETINSAGKIVSKTRLGVVTYPMVRKHEYMARRAGNDTPPGYSVITIKAAKSHSVQFSVNQIVWGAK